jgi:hypothetical protein
LSREKELTILSEEIAALQDGLAELRVATGNIVDDLAFVKESYEAQNGESKRKEILRWLRIDGIESDARYKEALSQRHGVTGSWILETESFLQWSQDASACLWLYGIGMMLSHHAIHVTRNLY